MNFFWTTLACIFLGGCGFRPLLDPGTSVKALEQSQPLKITVQSSSNSLSYEAYKMRRELESMACFVPYRRKEPITISILLSNTSGAITYGVAANIQRSHHQLSAQVRLSDQGRMKKEVLVDAISSYSMDIQEAFPSLLAEEATRERLIRPLAERIIETIIVNLDVYDQY